MSRWPALFVFCLLLSPAVAQEQKDQAKSPPAAKEQEPPEEDANLETKQYSFNPLQAKKEIQVGDEYYKKHSYKAAAGRYREATRWNPNLAEAWLHLGEAEEKRHNSKDAKEAFSKYLELQPDAKDAEEIRKKIAKLGK